MSHQRRPRVIAGILAAFIVVALTGAGCGHHSQSQKAIAIEQQQQGQDSYQQEINQPIPQFRYSQLRQNMIELETALANGVRTTSFMCSNLCSKAYPPFKVCPSIGAPIPVTDSLTNPDQIVKDNLYPINNGGGNEVLPLKEPTGVYIGPSTGTYVMCVGADGAVRPFYWEGYVAMAFAPAVWNYSTGTEQDVGPPSFHFSTKGANRAIK